MEKCKICNKEVKALNGLGLHIAIHKITKEQYYVKFLKRDEKEGFCIECGKPTNFISLKKGYFKYCSHKCLANSGETREKCRKTCVAKYGTTYPNQSSLIRQKISQTHLEIRQNPETILKIAKKFEETNIKKYGVKNPSQLEEVKWKKKKTCKEHYGVENPSQHEIILRKKRETRFKIRLPKVEDFLKSLHLKNLEPYVNAYQYLKFKCLICNTIFENCYNYLQQGHGRCPNCYPKYKSIAETEILNYIKSLNLETVENSRNLINPLELDIYLPGEQVAIEYNGLYWHSELKNNDKNYHLNKLKLCLQKGITLVQIFEDEWIFHQNVVKSRLKQILGVNKAQRIHARTCVIKPIVSKIKNEFLNTFHLQGSDNSPISLGAFNNDQLIAVMTFNHGSLAKGVKNKKEDVWELNRYCCDYVYHIPGIASKLLSYFKKNYEWKKIYSFADRRWSIGNLYKVLGFELEKETSPNYWYVKGLKRIHRFSLRKRGNEPKDIPEHILRMQEGYTKIWDCGNLKFSLCRI